MPGLDQGIHAFIGPHNPEGGDGGVEFYIHAESPTPIDVMVTITVLEDVESTTVV